jgi:hypothetical protein
VRRRVLALALVLASACGQAASAPPPAATVLPSPTDSETTRPQVAVAPPLASESPTPSPTPIPTIKLKLDAGWTAADRSADGFAMGLPPRWHSIDLDPYALDASLRAIDDPQYQTLLRQQTASLLTTGVKLFAFDLSATNVSTSGFTTNLNVIEETLPYTVSLDVYAQVTVAQLEQLDAVSKPIGQQRVTLPAGPSQKLSYRVTLTSGTTKTTSAITQYLLVNGNIAYVLTFTTTPAQLGTYAPTFAKMAATLTLAK